MGTRDFFAPSYFCVLVSETKVSPEPRFCLATCNFLNVCLRPPDRACLSSQVPCAGRKLKMFSLKLYKTKERKVWCRRPLVVPLAGELILQLCERLPDPDLRHSVSL